MIVRSSSECATLRVVRPEIDSDDRVLVLCVVAITRNNTMANVYVLLLFGVIATRG